MSELRYQHLLGREWRHHEADCYALMREFYRDNWGLEMRDYARSLLWWQDAPELDLIRKNFHSEGFNTIHVDNHMHLLPGDGLLIARGTRIVSHCGAWIGGNQFLHHPYMGLSKIERWAGKWASATLVIARHPAVKQPEVQTVPFTELLSPDLRRRFDG